MNIRGYDGKPKTLTTKTETSLGWMNKDDKKFIILLDQAMEMVSIENDLATLNYMFQLFGAR